MIAALLLLTALLAAGRPDAPPGATTPPGAAAPYTAPPAFALQQGPPISFRIDERGAALLVGSVLADRELAEAARSGLPLRLRIRVELWRDKFIDQLVEGASWSTVIAYEPLSRRFFVRSTAGDQAARVFGSLEAARTAVEGAFPLQLRPRGEGRYYYTASLEVETLSLSDLQELERWLQGNLSPAGGGEGSIPGAIGEGAKRLLIRVLGAPSRRFEGRSNRFRVP